MQKKIRFFFEYSAHYLRRYSLAIIGGICFGSIIFTQRNNLINFYLNFKTFNQNIGIEGLYTTQTLPLLITSKLSYGFSSISENDKATLSPIVSNLELKDNNQTYVFTFKNNLYWHDGKKLKASDIKLNILGATISPISDNRLEIKVSSTFSPLLSILSAPLFADKTLTGLGEYQVNNLVYRDGYLKLLTLSSTKNKQTKVSYHFYNNSSDLLNAFKLGEVDEISTDILDDQLTSWPNIKVSQAISTQKYLGLFINTDKISNKQLRQAIAYATPKTNDKNSRCLGPISPSSWAYNPQIKEYRFNATRAKELFEKNKIESLNLVITDRKLLPTAEKIKQSWEQVLGIKVNLSVQNQQINLSDYETLLTFGSIPSDPDQYSFWHSTQTSTNITHLNNSRIDKLLENGRLSFDQQERKSIYYDFQKFILEESPVVFLEFPTTYTISRLK